MKIINNVKYVLLRIFNSYVVDLHQPAILGFYLIFAFFTLWLVLKYLFLGIDIITNLNNNLNNNYMFLGLGEDYTNNYVNNSNILLSDNQASSGSGEESSSSNSSGSKLNPNINLGINVPEYGVNVSVESTVSTAETAARVGEKVLMAYAAKEIAAPLIKEAMQNVKTVPGKVAVGMGGILAAGVGVGIGNHIYKNSISNNNFLVEISKNENTNSPISSSPVSPVSSSPIDNNTSNSLPTTPTRDVNINTSPDNSPGDWFVSSPLSPNEIMTPLKELLFDGICLEILILFSLLVLAFLFFKNIILIKNLSLAAEAGLDQKKVLRSLRLNKILFIIVFVYILILFGLHIWINAELFLNTQDYIKVHQYLLKENSQNIIKNITPLLFIKNKFYPLSSNNLEKATNFLEKENSFSIEDDVLKLIYDKKYDKNYMPEFKLVDSFYNIISTESNLKLDNELDNEYGIINMYYYKKQINNLLDTLEDGKIYKCIFRWQGIDNNSSSVNIHTSPSFIIHKNTDIDVLLYQFMTNLNEFENKYAFDCRINLDIFIKEWISEESFRGFQKLMNIISEKEKNKKKIILTKKSKIDNSLLNNVPLYNKNLIQKSLAIKISGINYGNLISKSEIFQNNYQDLFGLDLIKDNLYSISKGKKNFLVLTKSNAENNKISLNTVHLYLESSIKNVIKALPAKNLKINLKELELENWEDKIFIDNGNVYVNRYCSDKGYYIYFENKDIINIEILFNTKKLVEGKKDFDYNNNIGVLDIETYNNANGEAVPYAIGYKTEDGIETSYIDSYLNYHEMIYLTINSMLTNKNNNKKFYSHNFSGFDGILILKVLMSYSKKKELEYKVSSDNSGKIISLTISKRVKNKKVIKISILDSYLLAPFSLEKLAKVFNCRFSKGIFPYSFINEDNLEYKGIIPNYSFYSNITHEEYLDYKLELNNFWDCKEDTLNYLSKDLDILFEIMLKFSKTIFENYSINITRIKTLAGLAFLIYNANYYNNKNKPIYFTNGKLEEFIRKGYYGGIVDLITHYTDYTTYKYDVNSHYPNAMLMPMPGGKPKLSFEKNLDNIFGFVEAKVLAPSEENLKVPILPLKLEGKTITFRGIGEGVWWSEELKMCREYGYKILEIKSSIQFEKTEKLFDDYVEKIYDKKVEAEKEGNEVIRLINKLLLNSLYGRLGINDNNISLNLVRETELEKILLTENSEILFKNKDISLVKSRGLIDPELLEIINNEKLYNNKSSNFNSKNPWKSLSSSVQFSAAITAYGRMYLNQFKNIKSNPYLGGDTDSIILTNPLESKFVGTSLGQFKLEHIITEGFYLTKKFYLYKTDKNEIIIKCKGINNKNKDINYNTFIELFKGNSIKIDQIQFTRDYKTLEIKILKVQKEIKGLKNKEINKLISDKFNTLRDEVIIK